MYQVVEVLNYLELGTSWECPGLQDIPDTRTFQGLSGTLRNPRNMDGSGYVLGCPGGVWDTLDTWTVVAVYQDVQDSPGDFSVLRGPSYSGSGISLAVRLLLAKLGMSVLAHQTGL